MTYSLALIASHLFGYDKVIAWLRSRDKFASAWEIASARQLESLRSDPTSTYTIDYAEREVFCAELALQAKAYEWAWVNASDALAIFDWKGEHGSAASRKALDIRETSEEAIDDLRVEELRKAHGRSVSQHNNSRELRFKQRIAETNMGVWRKTPARSRPRISTRPY
jgi:hypothetical protein